MQAEPVTEFPVDVTFLRMDAPPAEPPPPMPTGLPIVRVRNCSVPFYRFLYDTVGAQWLWWMRRAQTDAQLARLLAHPTVSVHVLYGGGQPTGFYELERRPTGTNLSYFGLMPFAIGKGVGRAFLRHAIDAAWADRPKALTVNTSSTDHPAALPNYLAAGFAPLRTVREQWRIPVRLGLTIPERLR